MSDSSGGGGGGSGGGDDDLALGGNLLEGLLPGLIIFILCVICCCKSEQQEDDPANDRIVGGLVGIPFAEPTPPQSLEERREAIDSRLIKRIVVASEPSSRHGVGGVSDISGRSGRRGMKAYNEDDHVDGDGDDDDDFDVEREREKRKSWLSRLGQSERTFSSFVSVLTTRTASQRTIIKFSEVLPAPPRRIMSAPPLVPNSENRTEIEGEERGDEEAATAEAATAGGDEDEGRRASHLPSPPRPPTRILSSPPMSSSPSSSSLSRPPPPSSSAPSPSLPSKVSSPPEQPKRHRHRRKANIVARTLATTLRMEASDSSLDNPVTCDICLMEYEVGEQVAWSPNDACIHAFHTECITDWLLRSPNCPLCRNDYLERPDDEGKDENQHQHHQPHDDDDNNNSNHNASDNV